MDEKQYFGQFIGDYDPVVKWKVYNCRTSKDAYFEDRESALKYIYDSINRNFPGVKIETEGGQYWTIPYTLGEYRNNFVAYPVEIYPDE